MVRLLALLALAVSNLGCCACCGPGAGALWGCGSGCGRGDQCCSETGCGCEAQCAGGGCCDSGCCDSGCCDTGCCDDGCCSQCGGDPSCGCSCNQGGCGGMCGHFFEGCPICQDCRNCRLFRRGYAACGYGPGDQCAPCGANYDYGACNNCGGCGGCNNGYWPCGSCPCGCCERYSGCCCQPQGPGCCASGDQHYNFAPGPPVGQVAYPYYTVRGPRDFLTNNPPSIGPY
jgi:hypothetical protein